MLLLLVLLISTCNKPSCKNSNPVFENYAPGTKAYNNELATQLRDADTKAKFWIEGYETNQGKEYMTVEVQAQGMCAKMCLDITGNTRLEQFRKVKGMSYSGAELSGLYYHIVQNDSSYSFVFDDVDWIVD